MGRLVNHTTDYQQTTTTMTGQRNKERQKGKRKTKGKDKQGKTINEWAYKKLPTYKTRSKIILKMPKAEIPNRNFSLRSNPIVLFTRTFER
jgi:hypothetical protein